MPSTIHHRETNATEEWVIVNDDGTITHEVEDSGWVALKGGVNNRKKMLTADEARAKWPNLVEKINNALSELGHAK